MDRCSPPPSKSVYLARSSFIRPLYPINLPRPSARLSKNPRCELTGRLAVVRLSRLAHAERKDTWEVPSDVHIAGQDELGMLPCPAIHVSCTHYPGTSERIPAHSLCWPYFAQSLNMFFRIFPVLVLGSSSITSTSLGTMNLDIWLWCFAHSTTSLPSTVLPCLTVT